MNNRITGKLDQADGNKYAYLFIKKSGNDGDTLVRAPLTEGQFSLNAVYDLKGRLCAYADVFYSADSSLTLDRVKQMYKSGYRDYRSIVLEDLQIETESLQAIRVSKVNAGKLNREFDLYFAALANGTELGFINDHPGSPISLLHLKARQMLDTKTQLFFNEPPFDYVLWFSKLDPYLKTSVEGKEFQKLINSK